MPALMDPAVETLAQRHRVQQLRNAAVAAILMRRRWLTATAAGTIPDGLLGDLVKLILTYRTKAGQIAAAYGTTARRQSIGGTNRAFKPQVDVPLEKLQVSLNYVALHPGQQLTEKMHQSDDARLRRTLLTELKGLDGQVAGAGMRHVADAGRDTVRDIALNQDRQALGYVRVTKARSCYFCAMLASRGPVYDEESFHSSNKWFEGDGPAKVHDNCNCTLALVYTDQAWPARSAKLHEAWQPGMSLNEWRHLYDSELRDRLL